MNREIQQRRKEAMEESQCRREKAIENYRAYRESLPNDSRNSIRDRLVFLIEDLKIIFKRIPSANEVDNKYLEGGSFY